MTKYGCLFLIVFYLREICDDTYRSSLWTRSSADEYRSSLSIFSYDDAFIGGALPIFPKSLVYFSDHFFALFIPENIGFFPDHFIWIASYYFAKYLICIDDIFIFIIEYDSLIHEFDDLARINVFIEFWHRYVYDFFSAKMVS